MRPWVKGVLLSALQMAIVLSLGAKLLYDRNTLPRVWARTAPVDPDSPLRGRYLSLQLDVNGDHLPAMSLPTIGKIPSWQGMQPVKLIVENAKLTALPDDRATVNYVMLRKTAQGTEFRLQQPVDFYIPEGAADPSRRPSGEELWVEVTIPVNGPPRPIRLGVMKEGKLTPLDLR